MEHIDSQTASIDDLLRCLRQYSGRFAIIYRDAHRFVVLHDALGLREIYYCTSRNVILCGSQPHLIAGHSDPQIGVTADPDVKHFYSIDYRDKHWIGDDTYFRNVKHLSPNHLLDLNTMAAERYWPSQVIARLPLDTAVERSCAMLQGLLRAVAERHEVMIAVTAGTDSRTLLAASRSIKDKVYYFINDHGLTAEHPDIRVPRSMCASIGVPFHVHSIAADVESAFKKVFFENVFQASGRLLPTIYNIYFKTLSKKMNVIGIGEPARSRYGRRPKRLHGYRMAYALGYKDSKYVIQVCERLAPRLDQAAKKFEVNPMTLLYWEQTLGNWGAVGNAESDIAIEEFDPFACHSLFETLLGVDERHTRYSGSRLFHEMIRTMWPELLRWPINPPQNATDRLKWGFKKLHVFPVVKELRYQVNFGRDRLRHGLHRRETLPR